MRWNVCAANRLKVDWEIRMKRDYLTLGIACLSFVIAVYALVTLRAVRSDHQQNLERLEKLQADIRSSLSLPAANKASGSHAAVSNAVRATQRNNSKPTLTYGPGEFSDSDEWADEEPLPEEVEVLVDTIVSRVQERLDNQVKNLERENKRDRNRSGQWRAQIEELAEELELDEEQMETTTAAWNALKDEAFEFAKTDLGDGSSLLDDLIAQINAGTSRREAWGNYFGRMGDKMPGSDMTFGEYFEQMRQNLEAELTQNLTEEQMDRLRELKVAWWEIGTGHSPWRDYMEENITGD